jgi:hypothetical protein
MTYKAWKYLEAQRLSIKLHTFEVRLWRGTHPEPRHVRRGASGRIVEVLV